MMLNVHLECSISSDKNVMAQVTGEELIPGVLHSSE